MTRVDSLKAKELDMVIAPSLSGKSVLLQKPSLEERCLKGFFELYGDADVGKHNIWQPTSTLADCTIRIQHFINQWDVGERYRWGIWLVNTQTLVGDFVLVRFDMRWQEVEIGFNLAKAYWKQNIMSEALEVVLPYLHQKLNLTRITALVCAKNTAALTLLSKFKFNTVGTYKNAFYKDGFTDNILIKQRYGV